MCSIAPGEELLLDYGADFLRHIAEEERRASEQRQAVCAEKLRQLNLRKQQQQQEQRPKSPEMEMGSPVEPRAG